MSITREQLSPRTVRVLDASRALAALAVVLQHARLSLLVDPESVTSRNLPTRFIYWVCGFGHEAVIVFFVLSGVLVGGSVVRSVTAERWTWSEYMLRRLSRLYIVLIPALLLIVLWDGLGARLFPHTAIYPDFMSSITVGGRTLIVHNRSVFAYLGNAAFLMTISVKVFGSGGALWSLSNEFWYYVLFPCMALAVALRHQSGRSLWYVVLLFGIAIFVGGSIVEWMSVWLLGVAVVYLPRPSLSPSNAVRLQVSALIIFMATTALVRTLLNRIVLRADIAVGISFALLLYFLFCAESSGQVASCSKRSSRTWKSLAGFSYSLYLFHQPPLTFASAWLQSEHHSRFQPTATHVGIMICGVVLAVIYSYALSLVTEARTDALRHMLKRAYHSRWKFLPGTLAVN